MKSIGFRSTATRIAAALTCAALACAATACGGVPSEVKRAQELEAKSDFKGAAAVLSNAEAASPGKAVYPHNLGLLYARHMSVFFPGRARTITVSDPDFQPIGEAVMMRDIGGRVLGWQLPDYAPACEAMLRGAKQDAGYPDAWLDAGNLYAQSGRLALAHQTLAAGFERHPGDARFPHVRAFVYECERKWDEAVRQYEISEKLDDGDSATPFNRADALFKLNRPADGLAAYDRVLDMDKDAKHVEKAVRNSLQYYLSKNLYKDAVAFGKRWKKHLKKLPANMLAFGKAAYLAEDYDAAKVWLADGAKRAKADAGALAMLGQLAYSDERWTDAEKYFIDSIKLRPMPQTFYQLGRLYLEHFSMPQRAAEVLERAVKLSPRHYPALFDLARALAKSGATREKQRAAWYAYLEEGRGTPGEETRVKEAEAAVKALGR